MLVGREGGGEGAGYLHKRVQGIFTLPLHPLSACVHTFLADSPYGMHISPSFQPHSPTCCCHQLQQQKCRSKSYLQQSNYTSCLWVKCCIGTQQPQQPPLTRAATREERMLWKGAGYVPQNGICL